MTGTVALGSGQSFLDEGRLGGSVATLARGEDRGRALTVAVQERLLTVVFTGSPGSVPRTGRSATSTRPVPR
ncbi:hypothetical protein [Streptomyces sp. BE303]|uniref:hypothetical protein n=1 Tax=Streptomyces sp. BE303 TaxID=3002528 RepID=UPI002E781507|nr:hypothetical protein [Streptomyces sp. BE303]